MSNLFTKVSMRKPRSNVFNLSHERKMAFRVSELVPFAAIEAVPGDKFNLKTTCLARLAPIVAPFMHAVTLYYHWFFVPNRLLWDNWENFITGGEDGDDESNFPYLSIKFSEGGLGDYMGLPTMSGLVADAPDVSAMPFAAYQLIYTEYYRDQNLITTGEWRPFLSDGDNSATSTLTQLRRRAWMHDYFTSALPWTQKGAEATIPLGSTAPLIRAAAFDGTDLQPWENTAPSRVKNTDDSSFGPDDIEYAASSGLDEDSILLTNTGNAQINIAAHTALDPSKFEVNLVAASAATINDLRQAFKLQEWLEKNARGGSRYTESILSHFGVRSSDARLQRPEFIGGGSIPIQISEVLQTSGGIPSESTPQGNMAGHGIGAGSGGSFKYFAEEHGYLMCIGSMMPKTAYQQGIPKHFLRFNKFDYYWPEFAHLGEEAILNKELYVDETLNDDVFGYTPRYSSYKYIPDSVHGSFRSSLDFWHLGRIFSSRPNLNQNFIECDPGSMDRASAVPSQQENVYAYVHHNIKARRLMPYFGTPGGI